MPSFLRQMIQGRASGDTPPMTTTLVRVFIDTLSHRNAQAAKQDMGKAKRPGENAKTGGQFLSPGQLFQIPEIARFALLDVNYLQIKEF